MPDTDGVEEALEGTLRVALTAAARLAEQIARQRETALRQAEANNARAAREYRARLDAERAAARAALQDVRRAEWWDTASVDAISRAYQTAHVWSAIDAHAAAAQQIILDQARQRHGIDVDDLHPPTPRVSFLNQARAWAQEHDSDRLARYQQEHDTAATAAARRDAEHNLISDWEQAGAAERRTNHSVSVRDEAIAAVVAADRDDRAVPYDSAERRSALAEQLEHVMDPETVDSRVRADTSQAKPATAATGVPHESPKARRPRRTTARQHPRDLAR